MADGDAERWDAKYTGRPLPESGPSSALRAWADVVPTRGRALDLAGGDGAQAVWMAQRGLDVTLVDVSAVALERAASLAATHRVSLHTVLADLELGAVPPGPWDFVLCTNYLQGSLWTALAATVSNDGVVLWLHPTVRNLERHEKPSRRFLLAEGEGARILEAAGFDALHHREDWIGEPARHVCQLGARRGVGAGGVPGRGTPG
ncbi:MAG: class I SAM-dependent methyltransferase [Myxococcota bacterium]